jgi:hypothetical protein
MLQLGILSNFYRKLITNGRRDGMGRLSAKTVRTFTASSTRHSATQ